MNDRFGSIDYFDAWVVVLNWERFDRVDRLIYFAEMKEQEKKRNRVKL